MKKIKLNNPADQVWISLREVCPSLFKNKYDRSLGYRLSEGDIIKFGRVRFKVKAISTRKKKQAESKYDNNDASWDVSMNECLIRRYSNKRTEKGVMDRSFDSASIRQDYRDSNKEESILEKISKWINIFFVSIRLEYQLNLIKTDPDF